MFTAILSAMVSSVICFILAAFGGFVLGNTGIYYASVVYGLIMVIVILKDGLTPKQLVVIDASKNNNNNNNTKKKKSK